MSARCLALPVNTYLIVLTRFATTIALIAAIGAQNAFSCCARASAANAYMQVVALFH